MTRAPKPHQISRRSVLASLAALPVMSCRSVNRPYDTDILILGAGLSGLNAAMVLEEAGRDVIVLESATRVGGRLHTLDYGAGLYTEGGGEQIGANYARILDRADRLGVPLIPDARPPPETLYVMNHKPVARDSFATFYPESFAGQTPSSILFRTAAQTNPFTSATDWWDPAFMSHDISAQDFLTAQGIDGEGLHLIDHTLNGNDLETYSMLNLYRSLHLFSQSRGMGPSLSVKGGAQRLPEAMAAGLHNGVKTGQHVVAIESDAQGVTVTCADGRIWRAAHVICTLPFPALRHVDIRPGFAATQNEAIAGLPYTQVLQVHFAATNPFWEQDGLPANMWTNSGLERVFMDTDKGVGRIWVNGRGAMDLNRLADTQIADWAKEHMAKDRPSSQGQVGVLAVQRWTDSTPLAGGAYMHWAPGQVSRWAQAMGQSQGRLLFAGEHLSLLHTGMEGAMESGENAAFAILGI